MSRKLVGAIVLAALAGDVAITVYLIGERAIVNHVPLAQCLLELMQWDASNAYGIAAFSGGWGMAALGQAMDLVVSLAWAALFALIAMRIPTVRQATWAWGLAYGVVVMFVMLFLIVPLGHAHQVSKNPVSILNVLVAHTVFFGLPVAVVTVRFAALGASVAR